MQKYCKNYKQTGKNPFAVIPWSEDFLYAVQNLVDMFAEEQHISMQDIVLVFPNARPKRYLTARYKERAKQEKKAGILPQIYTNTEFYTLCLHHFERGLPLFSELEPLDRYAKLFEIVKSVLQEKKYSHFSSSMEVQNDIGQAVEKEALQLAKFYPWAQSLDTLFEECFHQLILPQNIQYADEVSLFAQSLLKDIEEIFAKYTASMQEKAQTTPAYSLFRTARYVQAYGQYQTGSTPAPGIFSSFQTEDFAAYFADFMPYLLQGKRIIFAGFVSLSKAEDVILKYFWEQGACICFDTDSRLVTALNNLHYSCIEHKKWLQRWQAEAVLLSAHKEERKPEISFYPAYDFHSQLTVLKESISPYLETTQDRDDYCAVVLPNSSLLMPVLHELPNKNINISVGYPLQRTLLWQFIVHIFNLQLNKKELGENQYQYQTADLLALFEHPFTKMLLSPAKSSENSQKNEGQTELCTKDNFATWRKVLYYADKHLAEKACYVDFANFVTDEIFDIDENAQYYDLSSEKMGIFVEDFFHLTVFVWENINTLQEVGERLNSLMDFFIEYGESVWNRFPLDKEGLVRFFQNTIPTLMQNGLAQHAFPLKTLYSILEQCIMAERVPFEADPLTGLQVLGMLETRLLSFKNVFILDCVESVLPPVHAQDPLMPDSLRALFGLPDRHSRDMVAAHTFYRLIHSAEKVFCYWQGGVQSSEIQNSKSMRSRFVEELIWEKEKFAAKKGKKLKEIEESLFHPVLCTPHAPDKRKKRSIEVTDTIFSALEKKAEKGFSTDAFKTYLQCPVRFYYQYLAKITAPSKEERGDNFALFGTKMHEFLKEQYAKQQIIRHDENFTTQFMQDFHQKFNKNNWQDYFSADSYFMFQETGTFFLEKYLKEMPHEVEIVALEHPFSHALLHEAFASPVYLKGIADRVDKRGEHYFIIDYKTSNNNKKQISLWKNESLLEELSAMNTVWQSEKADTCLEKLAMNMEDIQLPFYLYLFAKDKNLHEEHGIAENARINASWIFLSEREKGCEMALIDEEYAGSEENMWDMLYNVREKYMDIVFDFILNHMAKEKVWKCKEGRYCGYCPFVEYC